MGAWGTGSFDNDGALDFLAEYSGGGAGVVESTLMELTDFADGDYIEVDIGQMAIVAAEIVAACNGRPAANVQADIAAQLVAHRADVSANEDLVAYAKAGVPKLMVVDASEIYQLGEEAAPADFVAFKSEVADLIRRLGEIG